MSSEDDELNIQKRHMENLLGDLHKLIPFFKTKTVTDIYIYSRGNI